MAKNFSDLNSVDADKMTRSQAIIYLLNFFNSRISAMNRSVVTKVADVMRIHNITTKELADEYVRLVYENS
jgi:hypothetical protein